jgi:hypothetical protein
MNSRFVRIRTIVLKLNQLSDEHKAVEEAPLGFAPSSSHNFTPAQHKIKDTLEASKLFGGKQELSEALHYAALLQCIIKSSEGKLQAAYIDNANAIELMGKNPKLESALKKAWRTKDYKEIRESGELRASSLACSERLLNSLPEELLTVLKRKDELSIPKYDILDEVAKQKKGWGLIYHDAERLAHSFLSD